MSARVNDIWTRKARSLGFPSRAVFKLIEAQQKFRLLRPGQRVLDLGCSPGSWTRLAARSVGRKGYVLGIDLTPLEHDEVRALAAEVAPLRIGQAPPADQSSAGANNSNKRGVSSLFGNAAASAKVGGAAKGDDDAAAAVSMDAYLSKLEQKRVLAEQQQEELEGQERELEQDGVSTSSDADADAIMNDSTQTADVNTAAPAATSVETATPGGGSGRALLKAEARLARSRAPVRLLYGDVTEWRPDAVHRQAFDVVLSDMAPKTTGLPSEDAAASAELCHAVLDLCPRVMKPPVRKWVTYNAASADADASAAAGSASALSGRDGSDAETEADANATAAAAGAAAGAKSANDKGEVEEDDDERGLRDIGAFARAAPSSAGAAADAKVSRVSAATDLYSATLQRRLAKAGLSDEDAAAVAASVRAAPEEVTEVDVAVLKKSLRTAAKISVNKHNSRSSAAAPEGETAAAETASERRLETYYRGALLMKVFQGTDFAPLLKRVRVRDMRTCHATHRVE